MTKRDKIWVRYLGTDRFDATVLWAHITYACIGVFFAWLDGRFFTYTGNFFGCWLIYLFVDCGMLLVRIVKSL